MSFVLIIIIIILIGIIIQLCTSFFYEKTCTYHLYYEDNLVYSTEFFINAVKLRDTAYFHSKAKVKMVAEEKEILFKLITLKKLYEI